MKKKWGKGSFDDDDVDVYVDVDVDVEHSVLRMKSRKEAAATTEI